MVEISQVGRAGKAKKSWFSGNGCWKALGVWVLTLGLWVLTLGVWVLTLRVWEICSQCLFFPFFFIFWHIPRVLQSCSSRGCTPIASVGLKVPLCLP